jgi:phosphatidyl-myo-inositol dimannoside synthase
MKTAIQKRAVTTIPIRPQPEGDPAIRVLWVTTSFFPRLGGLEIFIERTLQSLSEICEVGLMTKSHHWIPCDSNIAHFPIRNPDAARPGTAWHEIGKQLEEIVERFTPDFVHFGSARSAIYRSMLPPSIRSFATVHGNDLTDARPRPGDPDPTPFIVSSLNACERIFPVSEHTAALCREWGVTAPHTVLNPGCDLDFFKPLPVLGEEARAFHGIPPETPLVLTVSRLVPRKGHLTVLDALQQLPFEAHWVVVGDGPCREPLEAEAQNRGIAHQVSFLGKVSDDDLLALYNACDVFVLTPNERRWDRWLDSEGFGLVLHEAGACGKPVITSNISGCSEAVLDGETGFLVPPDDPSALSEALYMILSHGETAAKLGSGGLDLVHSLGGWPRLASQLLEEYKYTLSQTNRKKHLRKRISSM